MFHHLADEGLHPILGGTGDPGAPAAQLLEALGIRPAPEGNRQVSQTSSSISPRSGAPSSATADPLMTSILPDGGCVSC